jgi:hypothetical protein
VVGYADEVPVYLPNKQTIAKKNPRKAMPGRQKKRLFYIPPRNRV